MSWSPWRVVRYGLNDSFGVMRTRTEGRKLADIEYGKDEAGLSLKVPTYEAAAREAEKRNGRTAKCTPEQFEVLTGHVPMYANTRMALHAIMVEGATWRDAAQRFEVTESGILRAMRRVNLSNA